MTTDRDYEAIRRIKSTVNPAIIVLPLTLRSNKPLMRIIRESLEVDVDSSSPVNLEDNCTEVGEDDMDDDTDHADVGHGRAPVRFVQGTEFSLPKAKQNISLINLLGMPEDLAPREKIAFLSHSIDLECEAAFRAVGGLVGFLLEECIINTLEGPNEPVCFNSIRQHNFGNVVHMSRGTVRALQVFQLDAHPLGHGSGLSKEGLSLFGVLHKTKSVIGGRLLRAWISSPSTDIDVIHERQRLIASLRSPSQDAVFAALESGLRGVKNVPSILNNLRTASASVNDWQGLERSGRALLSLHDAISALRRSEPDLRTTTLFRRLKLVEMSQIRDAVKWISSVLDFAESKTAGRPVILYGFSDEIDQLRECYAGLDAYLTSIGVQEMGRIANENSLCIPRLQVVYLPQVGYLVLLDHPFLESPEATDGRLAEAGLEFMFSSPDEGGYFKNEQCYMLDGELGDIHGALTDLEAKAVRYLESKVLPSALAYYQACSIAAEVDCLVALADAANEHNWVRPIIESDYIGIDIENGRHALQELILPSFIPNSTKAKGGDVHIITGPNCSGKSVYCKQVGLIVVLAQIGSCVPATTCRLGIMDAIYTRIASHESVSINQSSFFIDASQVAAMLHGCSERSLVLLDEWGKGTNETDGMALFAATVSDLLARQKEKAPICFATTHFTELIADPYLPMTSNRLGVFSMDIVAEQENQNGASRPTTGTGKSTRSNSLEETIVFLYRLVAGSICDESRAILCAQSAGVPRDILIRSVQVRDAVKTNSQLAIPTRNGQDTVRLNVIIEAVRQFLDADLDEIPNISEWLLNLPL